MTNHRAIIVGVAVIAVCVGAGSAYARQISVHDDGLQRFQVAVDAYVALHRDVERNVPPLEISSEARNIQQAVDAMAEAIRAARPSARTGDIFDATAATVLRKRIRETLRENHYDTADLLAAMRDEDESAAPARAVVNGRFAWEQGSIMVPGLLEVLPRLPGELEYRLAGRDLVLIDTHAGLVVDILPDVLQ